MARMSHDEAVAFLQGGDHGGTAVLSVPVEGRGPLSVPMSFRFVQGAFRFSTKRSRRHARAFVVAGRATVLVHHERYEPGIQIERYVMAEGPIGFADDAPPDPDVFLTATLVPERFVGVLYDFSN